MTKFFKYILMLSIVTLPSLSGFAQPKDNDNAFLNMLGMGTAPQTTIAPANVIGQQVNDLYSLLTWIGIAILFIVVGVFVVIVYKFRASKNQHPKDMHGNTILEILWTAIPILILIVIAVPTVELVFKIGQDYDLKKSQTLKIQTMEGDKEFDRYLDITVVGHQWWWEVEYNGWYQRVGDQLKFTPIGKVTANEPWLPQGVPIKVNLTSEDVIHSFWPPRLSGKVDAVPGHLNKMNLFIEKEGFYYGLCAEYCGASHALMRFNIVGTSEEKFNEWLNWGQGEPLAMSESAKNGQEAFQSCLGCHTFNGSKDFMPRQPRFQKDLKSYEQARANFEETEKNWASNKYPEDKVHVFRRVILEDPERPVPPKRPKLFQGDYRTVAPDLTDFRFRKRILASIKENTKENLVNWIKNPAKMKPEIMGTPVIRMPAYEDIFDDETINDIAEYLLTVEYSESNIITTPQFTLLENAQ